MGKYKIVVLALFMFITEPVSANMLDSWMDQTASTNPSAHVGSQRGYLNGGSFSGRIKQKNDPLFNISPPSYKVGCGGIDIFMGSMDFAKPEYLATKAQAIISGAQMYAFDLALRTLCEPCANGVNKLTGALDRLNSLQLDDCKAGKALVATLASPLVDKESTQKELADNVNSFKVSSGFNNYFGATKDLQSNGGKITTAEVNSVIAGCSQKVKDVFGQSGSVLQHIGDEIGYPAEDINFLRGFIGDIIILKQDGYTVKYDPPCSSNHLPNMENFINGEAEHKVLLPDGITTSCQAIDRTVNGVSSSLKDHSKNLLLTLQTKMKDKSMLSVADKNAIVTSNLPVELLMKIAVSTGMEESLAEEISMVLAMDRVYKMMGDTTATAQQVVQVGQSLASSASSNATNCRVKVMESSMSSLQKLSDTALKIQGLISKQYNSKKAEMADKLEHLSKMNDFHQQQQKKLINKFSDTLYQGGK